MGASKWTCPLSRYQRKAGERGICEQHRCSHGTGVFADICGNRHDDALGVAAIWVANPSNLFEGNRAFTSVADAAYRFDMRGITGLSHGLPDKVKLASVGRIFNFKWKPAGPKGGFRDNVAHSCDKGLKNYPNHTPKGGILIERFTAFKNRAGLFAKNVYNYKNPYIADCKDGRSCGRYTVRDSTFIGNDVAVLSINGQSKIHVEESLIAPNLPVDLYPEAEGDAVLTQRYMTEGEYKMGKEGKHLPKQKNTWSLTFDDATLEAAKEYGYKTYAEKNKLIRAGKWSSRGGMSVRAQLGDYNQDYHNNKCGARGKVGPACHRDAVVFTKPE